MEEEEAWKLLCLIGGSVGKCKVVQLPPSQPACLFLCKYFSQTTWAAWLTYHGWRPHSVLADGRPMAFSVRISCRLSFCLPKAKWCHAISFLVMFRESIERPSLKKTNEIYGGPTLYVPQFRASEKLSARGEHQAAYSGAGELAQWVKVLADKSISLWVQSEAPTWWKERIDSYKLISDLQP